jgi:hypothetical protein
MVLTPYLGGSLTRRGSLIGPLAFAVRGDA